MQLSPARNLKGIRAVGFLNAKTYVCKHFLKETVTKITGRDILTVLTGEG